MGTAVLRMRLAGEQGFYKQIGRATCRSPKWVAFRSRVFRRGCQAAGQEKGRRRGAEADRCKAASRTYAGLCPTYVRPNVRTYLLYRYFCADAADLSPTSLWRSCLILLRLRRSFCPGVFSLLAHVLIRGRDVNSARDSVRRPGKARAGGIQKGDAKGGEPHGKTSIGRLPFIYLFLPRCVNGRIPLVQQFGEAQERGHRDLGKERSTNAGERSLSQARPWRPAVLPNTVWENRSSLVARSGERPFFQAGPCFKRTYVDTHARNSFPSVPCSRARCRR